MTDNDNSEKEKIFTKGDVFFSAKTFEEVQDIDFDNKIIGLYFSANWSPPCQVFTQTLQNFNNEIVKRKSNLEIIFVSCDKSENDMKTFMKNYHGNWLAIPYDNSRIMELRKRYQVQAIPKLIVIKANGEIITEWGRKDVTDRGISAYRSWCEDAGFIK